MHDEFARIEWLRARFELHGADERLLVGIGDDAAVIDLGKPPVIVTVDTQVEDVHFRRDLISCRELGYRAFVAAVSDVWAMGGLPSAALIALTLPARLSDHEFRELIEGLAEAAESTRARIVGGNLSGGELLTVTTSVFGAPVHEPVARKGAEPGHLVYVTGTLGAAAVGLALLEADGLDPEQTNHFVERWKRPPLNDRAATGLAKIASAAVDVSDGCLQDLGHLCKASLVGATLRADSIPTENSHDSVCEALGLDPLLTALAGGEDYELIFTAPASNEAASLGTTIGEITAETGVRVVDTHGALVDVQRKGFRHFS
jgi:thiamine-monophosphate kinase